MRVVFTTYPTVIWIGSWGFGSGTTWVNNVSDGGTTVLRERGQKGSRHTPNGRIPRDSTRMGYTRHSAFY